MSIFDWGKTAKGIGEGVQSGAEGIRFLLSGDLPPEERIKYEALLIEAEKIEAALRDKQIGLNMIDAESPSKFKSGWRPMLGWIAVTGFSLVFVIFPIAEWVLNIVIVFKKIALTKDELIALKPPHIDGWLLLNLLGAMLGIGTLRTIEKGKGLTK
jgi:hypothetical protein